MKALEVHRAAFLESMRGRYAPVTIESRARSLDAFLRFLAGLPRPGGGRGVDDHPSQGDPSPDVREVTRATIQKYQAWLACPSARMAERDPSGRANPTGRIKLATRTVLARLGAMRFFFKHLEATDAILMNPCLSRCGGDEGIQLPKLEDRLPRRVLSLKEARAVLNAPDTRRKVGIRDKALLELFYSTGIRVGEMTRLSIHDVDTRNGLVRVNQGKGARDRVVPMGRKAGDAVREYIHKVRSVWSQTRRDERALWLRNRTPHPPLSWSSIRQMVAHYGKKAGLARPLSPHVWRHTCATHLVAAGANIAHVQKLLGHRSLRSTQIYTRVTIPEIKKTFHRAHPRAKMTLGKGHPRERTRRIRR